MSNNSGTLHSNMLECKRTALELRTVPGLECARQVRRLSTAIGHSLIEERILQRLPRGSIGDLPIRLILGA
jgi:hypothetical protein